MINLKDLYASYSKDVYSFSLWLTGDRQEAEDITSETFIRAWVHKSRIRTETLKAYLFTISRNIYLQHQRKKNRQVALVDVHPDPASGPDIRAESQSELKRIQDVLQKLPEIDRAAFLLRIQHELPYEEVCRILDITISAAKVKIYRVRKKLITTSIKREVN